MSESVMSSSSQSSEVFRRMAREVNPISGKVHYRARDWVPQDKAQEPTVPGVSPPVPQQNWNQAFFKGLLLPFKQFPQRLGQTLRAYPIPVAAFLALLAATPLLAGIVALLTTIESVPLLAPFLQLVGVGFTGWWAYRMLRSRSNSQARSSLEVQGINT